MTGGRYAFLFTDLVASTEMWDRVPERMVAALRLHDEAMDGAISAHGGRRFKHTGDGVIAVFDRPIDAARAALDAQARMAATSWDDGAVLEARIGLHVGEAEVRGDDFFGVSVNRCARIMALAHGGQVLASSALASAIADDAATGGIEVRQLGEHALKGLSRPELVHQLDVAGHRRRFPPLRGSLGVALPPRAATPLIGRDVEVKCIREDLGDARLVTLVGPGGVGKTRLALEVAALERDEAHRVVAYVSLEAAYSSVVESTLAAALGANRDGNQPALDAIVGLLADLDAVLVLDNVEHVLDATARVVEVIRNRCPGVTTLVTSQSPLGLPGERVVEIEPLDTSPGGPAMQLFVDRAREVDPAFQPDRHRVTISELCRMLDGVPLAVELAAARVRSLDPGEIVERLDRRLAFLRLPHGHPGSRRATTLGEVIGWSHDLLDDRERRLFARLGAFRGWFTLHAAEVVAGFAPLDELDVVDLLDRLVHRSLVRCEEHFGARRFRLLESVAAFAAEQLAAGPDEARTRTRHAEHHLPLLAALDPSEPELVDALDVELPNVRAAVAWAAEAQPAATAELLMSRFRAMCELGLQDDALAWFRIVAGCEPYGGGPERALLLQRIGQLAAATGHDLDHGRAALEEAVAVAEQHGDAPRAMAARLQLATMLSLYPASLDVGAAAEHLAVLAEALDGKDDPWTEARMHSCGSLVDLYRRHSGAGVEHARLAGQAASAAGLDLLACNALALEGANRAYGGDVDEGLAQMEAAWAEAVSRGFDAVAASSAWLRGYASILLSDPRDARTWFERELASGRADRAPAIRRSLTANHAIALVQLGRIDELDPTRESITINGTLLEPLLGLVRGNLDEAERVTLRLLEHLRHIGDRNEFAAVTLWRARIHRARRHRELAARSIAEVLPIATEEPSCPYYEVPLRAELALLGDPGQLPRLRELAAGVPLRGLVARVHLAEAVAGPPEEQEGHFAAALEVVERYGLALERVEVLLQRSAQRRRAGDRTGADEDVAAVDELLARFRPATSPTETTGSGR